MVLNRLSRRALQAVASSAVPEHNFSRFFHASTVCTDDLMEVFVNGESTKIPKGSTVLQACDAHGLDIPRFCYHQKLSIAGNCRMCLVEVEKVPKPVASCAMPAAPGMKIKTDTPLVKKAREGVMEFLLINHPLDCPICDQGGECDLQDQAMFFGSDRGRFTEVKRAVSDKNLGPLVKTVMTRCIHCTRCVRFASEIAGVPDLGVTGRGRDSEIGTYVERLMTSELSGNVIDLCPVGALTSKPAAFTYRNWELKPTETIDISDGLGSNIRVDSRGTEVMRIIPRLNDGINEDWISDKARFQFDGLKRQRLTVPMVKQDGYLKNASWKEAFEAAKEALQQASGNEIKAVAGKLADAESMMALKDFINTLGSGNLTVEGGFGDLEADVRSSYIMNTGLAGVDVADVILLIGTNPRVEAPVFNARIRKAWLANNATVGRIGAPADLTYPVEHVGEGPADLKKLLAGHPFLDKLKSSKHPLVIVGSGVLSRKDRGSVLQQIHELVEVGKVVREDWNGYNVLHDTASRVAALDIGFLPSVSAKKAGPAKVVYLLGADDFDEAEVPKDAFVIYQGHHGDRGALRADVILPGAAYTEKTATYVNSEGRVQSTTTAVSVPGDGRDDWKIIRALSEVVGATLPYSTRAQLRSRLSDVAPHFSRMDQVERALWLNGEYFKAFAKINGSTTPLPDPFASPITNFYQTDAISRASQTMARCVLERERADKRGLRMSAGSDGTGIGTS